MKISYSFGMIDLMHYGHMISLKKAAEHADLRIFGLVSDEASRTWMGSLVSNEQERGEVLKGVRYVDVVMRQETFDPTGNLKEIHTKYPEAEITLFHGSDWKVIPAQKYVESIGGRAVTLDYYERLSPMRIMESLTKEDHSPEKKVSNLISTKANTLLLLKEKLSRSKIEELYVFTVGEYCHETEKVLEEIKSRFEKQKIVIRSSSEREDAFESSNAGHFDSVLGVEADNTVAVRAAAEQVMASYGAADQCINEQILVQSQTLGVLMSGVVFTRDIQRNRPYYVINYDDSGSTDSVTSGTGGRTVWMIHSIGADKVPEKWKKLIEAVREIEEVLSGMLLDIEFAVTEKEVVIFQVRPLAAAYRFGRKAGKDDMEKARLQAIAEYRKYEENGQTCYSDMAFWNPAEIIGDNPKNLDYSIYRQIITRMAWDEGIIALGYRNVEKELMYRFGNKPYISVEYAFEALMPAVISETLVKKLRDYYIGELKRDLSAHDKIEFEIVFNCFDFSLKKRLEKLKRKGFSDEELSELADALCHLTEKVIADYPVILKKDLDDIRRLESIRLDIQNLTKDSDDICMISKAIRILMDGIVKYGTPQFSRQARCAFIAKSLGCSLMNEGYLSRELYQRFLSSIQTVASDYERDYRAVLEGRMTKQEFCSIYGHLRAGTYNIRSPRYDQLKQLLTLEENTGRENMEKQEEEFCEMDIDPVLIQAVGKALKASGLSGLSGENVLFFMRKTTEEREYFKFVFTKSLSFAMELMKRIGERAGVDYRDLSYLELPEVFAVEYYSDTDRLKEFWNLIIEKRRELYKVNSELILPAVICCARDFDYIENLKARPNYITEKKVAAKLAVLSEDGMSGEIAGKIVCLEKADPGYDWIFSKNIAGLITKYGGAASHMAIRCAEFGIPAAIGCGAGLFDYMIKSERVMLDCKHENLRRLTGEGEK